jgi:hypothetical protein
VFARDLPDHSRDDRLVHDPARYIRGAELRPGRLAPVQEGRHPPPLPQILIGLRLAIGIAWMVIVPPR